ncbi:MAG: metallophosphoesterase [Clostridia bacterium]|nr:metallophosphoesterase [Clostridia bacterium]
MLDFIKTHPIESSLVALAIGILVAFVAWIIWSNRAVQLTKISINGEIKGLKIAHISDFHNAKFKNNNEKLLTLISNANPDIIAITGDLIDSRHTNVQNSIDLVSNLVEIAPCYYVPGNHESRIPKEYNELKTALNSLGVTVLEDEKITLEKDGKSYTLLGIRDPMFEIPKDSLEKSKSVIAKKLTTLTEDGENYKILLSHRPEAFCEYVSADINLALTGHAHGGQAQIPFIGGLIAPNQGFFPKYSEGLHQKKNTSMVISRGLGNSLCPLRFNNRPEVIFVEIV